MCDSVPAGLNVIGRYLNELEGISSELRVAVVANIKSGTKKEADYTAHSIETEFFSEGEVEEIVYAIRTLGIYVDVYLDEDKFILDVISGRFQSSGKKFNLVYNAAQNGVGPGRKSLIPAFCNLHRIPVTGSNPYVVSLCRHKYHYNKILAALGVPVATTWLYTESFGWAGNNSPPEGTKVILKPTYESASIGITETSIMEYERTSESQLNSLSNAFQQPVTVQQFVRGFEVEVPVFCHGNYFSFYPIGIQIDDDPFLDEKILTYDRVYNDRYGFYRYEGPASCAVISTAVNAARILGISAIGRIDFRITESGEHFVTDVSTNPHLTRFGSCAFLFSQLSLRHSDLLGAWLALSASSAGILGLGPELKV